MKQPHVVLFGDVVVDTLPALRKVFAAAKSRPRLADFLTQATRAVKNEYRSVSSEERPRHGDFGHLLELGELHASQDVIAASTILAVVQLGEYLILAEEDPSILNTGANEVYQLGVCQGALPGAVAAVARDTSQVVSLGVEVLRVVFRLGIHLVRRSEAVEDSDASWVIAVLGLDPAELQRRLDAFNKGTPISRHAYIGISTKTWSSVFAPPCTLERLHADKRFSDVPKSALPNGVAAHAPHLPPLDVEAILGEHPLLTTSLQRKSFFSFGTAAPFAADTLGDLLRSVILEMESKQQLLDDGLAALGDQLDGAAAVNITAAGPTPHESLVQSRLRSKVPKVVAGAKEQTAGSDAAGDGLAIVGMSGRFPQSDSVHQFWDLLLRGVDTCEEIPPSRFPIEEYYEQNAEGDYTTSTRFGCFLRNPGAWDHGFFNISPKEAVQMDPLHRMLLTCTYEALQTSGYAGGAEAARVATFVGQTTQDWWTVNDQHGPATHYMPSVVRAFTAGKLNHFFRFGLGYSNVDTACTSSFTALHEAQHALQSSECDIAVVGGGSLCTLPEPFCGLSKGGFLSPTGQCKTFQDTADGYCRGEAVGVVIVKRLQDAVRDNDNVLGVVNGITRSTNAGDVSITHPKESAQVALYKQLLRQTSVDPNDIGYVEMHGTGTIAGDTTELSSVRQIFARNRSSDNPLHVGALKANFGHSEAAAGISSLIKSLLILREGHIPRQPGYPFQLDRRFPDLNRINIRIGDGESQLRPWSRGDGRKKIVINGFDAAGGNASVLLSEAPARSPCKSDSREHHVVALSGKSAAALAANKSMLLEHLRNSNDLRLADLAYTSTARRIHELHRQAFSVSSTDDLVRQLELPSPQSQTSSPKPRRQKPSLVFAFSGQSTQYTGMASTLYRTCASFRRSIDHCAAICAQYQLASFRDIILGDLPVDSASAPQLQLAIVSIQIALARYWRLLSLEPDLVIGHSLGEYAALHVAGVFSLTDTLLLVHERASIVEERCEKSSHAMLAVAADVQSTKKMAAGCEVSCINGPTATVASGTRPAIENAKQTCQQNGVRATVLHGQYGFHSSQMDAALEDFRTAALRTHYAAPQIPVASTLLGEVVFESDTFNADYLVRHMRQPVNFLQAVQSSQADGFFGDNTLVFEIGTHPMCLGMISASLTEKPQNLAPLASLSRAESDWASISKCLATAWTAGSEVDWKQFHADSIDEVRLVELPTYAWQTTDHWIPYEARKTMKRGQLEPAQSEHPPAPPEMAGVLQVDSIQAEAGGDVTGLFSARTSQPDLRKAIEGHVVTGVALCPASVFIDMAFSAAKHLLKHRGERAEVPEFEVGDLEMKHPLILAAAPDSEQTVHVSAKMNKSLAKIDFVFSSREDSNAPARDLGSCIAIRMKDRSDSMWPRMRPMVQTRVDQLRKAAVAGTAHRILRPVVYRLFGAVVQYSPPYQAIQEVHMDSAGTDAVASLSMTTDQLSSKSFACPPYLSDALVHLAGFVLNGMLVDSSETIYIANKVESIRILGTPAEGLKLTCFCCFRDDSDERVRCCDVYVYRDDGLFAVFSGVNFTRMSRSVFAVLTGSSFAPKTRAPPSKDSSECEKRAPPKPTTIDNRGNGSAATTQAPSQATAPRQTGPSRMETFLTIAVEQTGLARDEIEEWTDFASIGVDSQMAIAIAAEMKKRTGVQLDPAFFITFSTIAEARGELDGSAQGEGAAQDEQAVGVEGTDKGFGQEQPSTAALPAGSVAHDPRENIAPDQPVPPGDQRNGHAAVDGDNVESTSASTSASPPTHTPAENEQLDTTTDSENHENEPLLLHGDPQSTSPPLFLIADESGEATPYLHFPELPQRRRVYAVESPFVDDPEKQRWTIEEICDRMVESIRRVQPRCPYLLGGLAAGGVIAVEVARGLASLGEKVDGLLLVDAALPQRQTGSYAKQDGSSASGMAADDGHEAREAHAAAMRAALEKYHLESFQAGTTPRQVCCIWSRDRKSEAEGDEWSPVLRGSKVQHFHMEKHGHEEMLSLSAMRGEAGEVILRAVEVFLR